jgi:hypothetical protein
VVDPTLPAEPPPPKSSILPVHAPCTPPLPPSVALKGKASQCRFEIIDSGPAPQPGGKIRYEWSDGKGGGFHLTGEYLELIPFSRIVHVERMHLPKPTPGSLDPVQDPQSGVRDDTVQLIECTGDEAEKEHSSSVT